MFPRRAGDTYCTLCSGKVSVSPQPTFNPTHTLNPPPCLTIPPNIHLPASCISRASALTPAAPHPCLPWMPPGFGGSPGWPRGALLQGAVAGSVGHPVSCEAVEGAMWGGERGTPTSAGPPAAACTHVTRSPEQCQAHGKVSTETPRRPPPTPQHPRQV